MSVYPDLLDDLATDKTDSTQTPGDHSAHHNALADATNKIEETLGVDPAGTYATVQQRLEGLGGLARYGQAPYRVLRDGGALRVKRDWSGIRLGGASPADAGNAYTCPAAACMACLADAGDVPVHIILSAYGGPLDLATVPALNPTTGPNARTQRWRIEGENLNATIRGTDAARKFFKVPGKTTWDGTHLNYQFPELVHLTLDAGDATTWSSDQRLGFLGHNTDEDDDSIYAITYEPFYFDDLILTNGGEMIQTFDDTVRRLYWFWFLLSYPASYDITTAPWVETGGGVFRNIRGRDVPGDGRLPTGGSGNVKMRSHIFKQSFSNSITRDVLLDNTHFDLGVTPDWDSGGSGPALNGGGVDMGGENIMRTVVLRDSSSHNAPDVPWGIGSARKIIVDNIESRDGHALAINWPNPQPDGAIPMASIRGVTIITDKRTKAVVGLNVGGSISKDLRPVRSGDIRVRDWTHWFLNNGGVVPRGEPRRIIQFKNGYAGNGDFEMNVVDVGLTWDGSGSGTNLQTLTELVFGNRASKMPANIRFGINYVGRGRFSKTGGTAPLQYDIFTESAGAYGKLEIPFFRIDAKFGAAATISLANPAVVGLTGHGLAAGTQIYFRTDGRLPQGSVLADETAVVADQPYYVLAAGLGADSFEFSTAPGGTPFRTDGWTQSGNHSVFADALGFGSGQFRPCHHYRKGLQGEQDLISWILAGSSPFDLPLTIDTDPPSSPRTVTISTGATLAVVDAAIEGALAAAPALPGYDGDGVAVSLAEDEAGWVLDFDIALGPLLLKVPFSNAGGTAKATRLRIGGDPNFPGGSTRGVWIVPGTIGVPGTAVERWAAGIITDRVSDGWDITAAPADLVPQAYDGAKPDGLVLGNIYRAGRGRNGGLTPASGAGALVADGAQTVFTIAHALGATPDPLYGRVSVQPANDAASAAPEPTLTADATNITLTFWAPPPAGTMRFYWEAAVDARATG